MAIDRHACLLFENAAAFGTHDAKPPGIFVCNAEQLPGALGAAHVPAGFDSVPSTELGMCDMPIVVGDIVARLGLLVAAHPKRGRGLELWIDMSWLLNTPSGVAHQGEFESALNAWAVGSAVRVTCLYCRQLFAESMLLDMLRTHPQVCTAQGEVCNPHYLPPAAFLAGDLAAQLDAWLLALQSHAGRTGNGAAIETLPSPVATAASARPRAKRPSAPAQPARAPVRRLKIRCFGPLRVYRQDGTPVRWDLARGATTKTKAIFAILLSCGARGVGAEELADLLWPDAQSSEQSLNRLYHSIHSLRVALEPESTKLREARVLLCRDHRYYLTLPDGTWIDQPLFEQFCRRGEELLRANRLEDSLACHVVAERLYSGPLFADIPAKVVESTDFDWCWSRRYWFEEMYVKMLTYMAAIQLRLGHVSEALEKAERALELSPCHEPAHQEAMRAFHASGRRDALDRQFHLCTEALHRFEDRLPSAQTRELYRELAGR